MSRIDARLERALLAIAVAAGVLLLLTVPDGEPILSGDAIPIAVAVGAALFVADDEGCGPCRCC